MTELGLNSDAGSSSTIESPGSGSGWAVAGRIIISLFLAAIIVVATVVVDHLYFVSQPAEPKSVPQQSGLPPQTEAIFQNGVDPPKWSNEQDEWLKARADHQVVAYAVFNCKKLSDVTKDMMPRQMFSALLLDLTPSGNHMFNVKQGEMYLC